MKQLFEFIICLFFALSLTGLGNNVIGQIKLKQLALDVKGSSYPKLPYGCPGVLNNFSANTVVTTGSRQDSLYQLMNTQADQIFDNDKLKKVKLDKKTLLQLFGSKHGLAAAKQTTTQALRLVNSRPFQVISVVSKKSNICSSCEYPMHDYRNLLVTVDSSGNLIDKLEIGMLYGSDLGQENKYYYMDKNEILHIKQFKSDEEGWQLAAYKKYKISSMGKFVKI